VYDSNAIEGNAVTQADTYIILASDTFLEKYSQKDNQEVASLYKGFKYILTKPALTADTLRRIHRYVLYFDPDNAGIYRTAPAHIGDKNLAPFERIPDKITGLFAARDESSAVDIFEQSAEFHLKFENIHPFIDGNGRVGRLVLNLMLIHSGFLPINLKVSDKGKYYRTFRQYDINKPKGVQELYSLITKCEYDELNKFISMF
jgi:Fic family protein